MALIFLSPSRQPDNDYSGGGTQGDSEQDHMTKCARILAPMLRNAGHEVIVLETRDYCTQAAAANDELARRKIGSMSPGVYYLAMHTNAGGGHGVEGWHNGNLDPEGRRMIEAVVSEVAKITPWKTRGTKVGGDFVEVNTPDCASGIVEFAFHDNPEDAAWIRENLTLLATAACKGMISVAGNLSGRQIAETERKTTMADQESVSKQLLFTTWPQTNVGPTNGIELLINARTDQIESKGILRDMSNRVGEALQSLKAIEHARDADEMGARLDRLQESADRIRALLTRIADAIAPEGGPK